MTFLLRPKRATSRTDVARDAHVVGCSAWRHVTGDFVLFGRMAVAAATHHSYDTSIAHSCTQTDDEVPAATCAATARAPVIEFVASAPVTTDIANFLEPRIPIMTPTPAVTPTPSAAPARVMEYVAPAFSSICGLTNSQFSTGLVKPQFFYICCGGLCLTSGCFFSFERVRSARIRASRSGTDRCGSREFLSVHNSAPLKTMYTRAHPSDPGAAFSSRTAHCRRDDPEHELHFDQQRYARCSQCDTSSCDRVHGTST